MLFTMAFRSLFRRDRRMLFLVLLLAFSAMIIFVLSSAMDTMIFNLEQKGAVYYGGDLNLKGLKNAFERVIEDPEPIMARLQEITPPGSIVTKRILYRHNGISFFFAGESMRQRIINGVDFDKEKRVFAQMSFVEGGIDEMVRTGGGRPGILISLPTAKLLKVRVGDDLLLYAPAIRGQVNTMTAVVRGVFQDSSLFGYYTSYMDIQALRGLVRFPEPQCTDLAVYFPPRSFKEKDARVYHQILEQDLPMAPYFSRQQDLWAYRDQTRWKGTKYALLSLKANLELVNELLDALRYIAYGLNGVLLGIVFFGVTNSYRIAFFERRKEIGMYRAMGMKKTAIVFVLLLEGALTAVFSVALGAAAALLALRGINRVNFSFLTGLEVFLRGGFLEASSRGGIFLLTLGLSLTAVLLALLRPVFQAASAAPAEAMRENR